MKRVLALIMVLMLICLCGCSQKVEYKTKYVDNCTSTEFREEPSNDAKVIEEISFGEAVSFVKDVKNGYSQIAYNGVMGYVLSANLSEKKPVDKSAEQPSTESKSTNTVATKTQVGQYDYLISSFDESYIEELVSGYIRPLYNKINNNISGCKKEVLENVIAWYENGALCKKEVPQGAGNYNMARQYYYDSATGEMVFAFVFKGTEEHRLYFKDSLLIRYIDSAGKTVNNPSTENALEMADFVINEAY